MESHFGDEAPRLNDRVRLSSDVVTQRMGEDMVLVHLKTNRIYDLNMTAARLWELMSTGEILSNIQDRMLMEFDVDKTVLQSEIHDTLTAMNKEGLLTFDA
jgi:Coenzyme PQQ synthesis protein D (PqqD)